MTFSPNPLVLGIAGPGATTSASVSVFTNPTANGPLQVASITTTDRTNWLCALSGGTSSLTVSIGTGCSGTSSVQLLGNQTYTGQILVTAPSSGGMLSGTLNVTLQVSNSTGAAPVATPNTLSFNVQTGGSTASQSVSVAFNGGPVTVTSVSASTTTGQNWLLPSVGSSSALVSINATGLAAATYSGTVTISTSAGSVGVPVTLVVGGIPTLTVTPATLNFAFQTGTPAPLAQAISLTSSGAAVSVNVSASTNSGGPGWLIVSPTGQLTTPAQITVTIQPAGLAAGTTYTGAIQINSGGATNGSVTIPVSLLVSNNAIIAANPSSLTFTAQAGGAAPNQSLSLTSSGTPLNFTVSSSVTTPSGSSWLQVPTQSGTTNGSITVAVNTAGLAVGTYTGALNVNAPNAGNGSLSVPVTLNITAGPVLQFNVSSLSFASQIGQSQPATQTVAIASTSGTVGFTAAAQTPAGQSWLSVSPSSGTAPGNIVVSVNAVGLAAGTYNGTVTVTTPAASNTPQTIQVTLVVSNTALLVVSPNNVSFSATVGSTASTAVPVAVTSTDGTPITFSVTATTNGSNWLLVGPTSGTTAANVEITANPAGLGVGTYTGNVTITATSGSVANSPQSFPVTLNIISSTALSVSATSLTFTQSAGGPPPASQNLTVSSSGANTGSQVTFSAVVSLNQGQGWLSVSPTNAATPAALTVTANGAGLVAGTYTGQIILSSPGIPQQTVNVTLTVGSGGGGFNSSAAAAQFASEGPWYTFFTLVNTSSSQAQAQLNFFTDQGNPVSLPLIFPQQGPQIQAQASSVTRTLNPGATLIIQTAGPDSNPTQSGWAQLLTTGGIQGFSTFKQTVGANQQEAVVPIETTNANFYALAFDNTNGTVTSVAIANASTQTAVIAVQITDDNGVSLGTGNVPLAALGHVSNTLASLFPATAGRRGTVTFQTPAGGQIAVLGLRFEPGAAFSTVPVLTR